MILADFVRVLTLKYLPIFLLAKVLCEKLEKS